jgi:hypothetical protein
MAIIHDHKLIFQHLPKTGGMALLDCLGSQGSGHQHLRYYDSLQGASDVSDYTSFTVVRDPVERFRSAMAMYMYPPDDQLANKNFLRVRARHIDLFERDDFNDSINLESVGRLAIDVDAPHFHSIISFMCHREDVGELSFEPISKHLSGNLVITAPDCVLQYEYLAMDWQLFTQALGIDVGPIEKKVNASKRKPVFTERSIAAIEHMYAPDYQLINRLLETSHISVVRDELIKLRT